MSVKQPRVRLLSEMHSIFPALLNYSVQNLKEYVQNRFIFKSMCDRRKMKQRTRNNKSGYLFYLFILSLSFHNLHEIKIFVVSRSALTTIRYYPEMMSHAMVVHRKGRDL